MWVGLAVLAYLLGSDPPGSTTTGPWSRVRDGFSGSGRGLAFGLGANLVFFRFVPAVIVRFTSLPLAAGVLTLVLLAALEALAWALAAAFAVQLARRGVPLWVSFGIGAYLGTFVPEVFWWTPAGVLSPMPEMVQLAEFVGERGVILLLALSAGLLASAVRYRPRRAKLAFVVGAALGIPVLMFAFGKARIARVEHDRADAPTVVIGLVQPSTDAVARWDGTRAAAILARLTSLTEISESHGTELTIWPEGAYPYLYSHLLRKCPSGARAMLAPGVRGPVLSGFLMSVHAEEFNSAAICLPDGTLTPPQDKIRLLAFGETIPIVGSIPWVRRAFHRATGLVPGTHNVLQEWDRVRASVLTCVEDTLPEGGREAMEGRPNLLVNLTNDAWFQGSRESELHLRLAALRSVESRRDMVRAVNFGPTSWIDAAGVVRARYDSADAGVLKATPALLEWKPTLFARFGDLPTAVGLVLVTLGYLVRARRSRASD
jgi:apolipoprotein N-acyltransferase